MAATETQFTLSLVNTHPFETKTSSSHDIKAQILLDKTTFMGHYDIKPKLLRMRKYIIYLKISMQILKYVLLGAITILGILAVLWLIIKVICSAIMLIEMMFSGNPFLI